MKKITFFIVAILVFAAFDIPAQAASQPTAREETRGGEDPKIGSIGIYRQFELFKSLRRARP